MTQLVAGGDTVFMLMVREMLPTLKWQQVFKNQIHMMKSLLSLKK
ncbi:hypothetical protein PT285_04810 [Lactobacillus sp. ESL0791]|nr:hypothetical protein [Lactobacillus sp. ESL0791]MDF7638717.1 hypothetical protein [Lactobacillus sp. ESL0791]